MELHVKGVVGLVWGDRCRNGYHFEMVDILGCLIRSITSVRLRYGLSVN